jgi:clan AA aspartic protease
MISGTVNTNLEPLIRVSIQDINGQEHQWDAVVDTGFNGWLTLPPDSIVKLGLRWQRLGTAILADGSQALFDVYEVTVIWDGRLITIPVDEADSEPLVGMSLMDGYELTIQAIGGGAVTLRQI